MKPTNLLPGALILLLALGSAPSAQEKPGPAQVPMRFAPVLKNQYTRLLQVYGSPEVQPGIGQTSGFSANGKLAVLASNDPAADENALPSSRLFVWDIERRASSYELVLKRAGITALALSADGTQALLGTATVDAKSKKPSFALGLWDLIQGKEITSFGNPRNPVFSIAISADGTRALSGTVGELTQWDLKQRKAITSLKVPDDKLVAAVAYLPDGKHALSGWAGEVRLWNLVDGKEIRAFNPRKPGAAVLGLAVSVDGKRFASADYDFSATLWETDTGKELGTWRRDAVTPAPTAAAVELALADEGKTVIACWSSLSPGGAARDSALVCRFDGTTGKEVWSKFAAMQGTVPVRITGKSLVLGGGANLFCEWDVANGKELRTWGGHKGPVTALARTPSGEILSAGSEGVLFLSGAGNQVSAWRAHDAAINALAIRKDGKLLTGSADKTVKLHDVATKTSLATLQGHTGNVTCVLFGDSDGWAASGSDDRTIILWDLKNGKKRQVLEGHAEGINALALSPAGDWLASASNDNTVRLWPLKNGRPDPGRDTVVLDEHKRQVTCVAFSPDGKLLLSAGQDQTIKLWDVAQLKVVREMKGHKNWIGAAVFIGPDQILSSSDDLLVCLWDAQTAKELDRIDLSSVADSPRSLVALGNGEFAVGTSGWAIMRFALIK
jgi:WD40 repeat protein